MIKKTLFQNIFNNKEDSTVMSRDDIYNNLEKYFRTKSVKHYLKSKHIIKLTEESITFNISIALQHTSNTTGTEYMPYIIQKWTNSKYYHTELVMGDMWISAIYGRGAYIDINTELRTNFDYIHREVTLTLTQYKQFIVWVNNTVGGSYDNLGIVLSQIFPFRYDNKRKWFCSELVSKLGQLLYIEELMSVRPQTVSPGRLANIFNINDKRK